MTEFPDTRATLLADIVSPENRRAWDEFVLIYRPPIYRMARRRGMQDADAQDVTQDILVRIANAIDQYKQQPETKFRHWLRRVARNAIFSALSRPTAIPAVGGSAVRELLADLPEASPAITQEIDAEYRREQYLQAAAIVRSDVNVETWEAFERTVVEGLSCEAAAEQLGKSIGTVYAARSRVVKRLRVEVGLLTARDEA